MLESSILAKSKSKREQVPYGRGSGIPHPADVYVGKRVRLRRQLLGMNQQRLGDALGLTFQQVQKDENGHNRVSASTLAAIAEILGVPISFFFEGMPEAGVPLGAADRERLEWMGQSETIDLIRFYNAIPGEAVRCEFLAMVKTVAGSSKPA